METDRKEATAKGTVVEGVGRASFYLPGKRRGTVCGQEEEIHNPCHL